MSERIEHMDADAINERIRGCLQELPPPCSAVCPLGLDIHDFIKKIKRGSVSGAYRMYRELAVFPRIAARLCAAPCEACCVRREADGAVRMQELELACSEIAGNRPPDVYNLPEKEREVIIVGAGLSGLVCALRLAAQRYRVTVYERENEIGGSLGEVMDREIYLEEFARQFTGKKYTLYCGRELKNLDGLRFDALYVATGSAGENFSGAPEQEKIFRGGKLSGASGTEIIRDGIRAAADIKAFLDLGFRDKTQYPQAVAAELPLNRALLRAAPPIVPADGVCYTKAEAVQEAERCLLCRCDACRQSCDLMDYYGKTPRRVADDVYATLHQVPSYTNRLATRFSNACSQCGRCRSVCPEGIDIGRLLLDTRREMYRDGYLPAVFHDFWLRDMKFSTTEAELLLPAEKGRTEFLFFPGCYLGASEPRYVTEAWDWLRKTYTGVGLFLSCCGAPALWGGAQDLFDAHRKKLTEAWEELGRPTLVLACPTCGKLFREELPQIPTVWIYELLAEKLPDREKDSRPPLYLFDPCAARGEKTLLRTVRTVAEKCGVCLENPDSADANDACCGWGGHIVPADPALHDHIVEKRVVQSGQPYLTYCVNCRDTFSAAGKEAYHIFDFVFGIWSEFRTPPTISRRRDNRRRLKLQLCGREIPPVKEIPLLLTAEQRRRMERDLISEEEVEAVVEAAEKTGVKVLEQESGHYITHRYLGNSTLWVEYQAEGNHWRIYRVYSHRMRIEGENTGE